MKSDEWFENAQNAIAFLSEKEIEQVDRKKKLMLEVEYLEKQRQVSLELLEEQNNMTDPNALSFFPMDSEDPCLSANRLQQELDDIDEKLLKLRQELQIVVDEKIKFDLMFDCLRKLKSEHTNLDTKKKSMYNEEEAIGFKLLETQEIERKRIARDLHDSTIQSLTLLVHKTELAEKLIDLDAVRARLELMSMLKSIRDTINEMRSIIYNLQPMSLNDLGLIETIEQYVENLNKSNKVKVHLLIKGERKRIADIYNLTLYRIIQEACSNAIKHANASNIKVEYYQKEDCIQLKICDDGCGFDIKQDSTKAKKQGHGYGLAIMRERVYLMSGSVHINSVQGKGTDIIIKIPITAI